MEKGKVFFHSEVSREEGKSSITVYENGNIESRTIVEETQLDRIENKVDRILRLVEKEDLSTSFDGNEGLITAPAKPVIYHASFPCLAE